MSTSIDESNVYIKLRDKAEALLQAGTTPVGGHWSMGVDALSLLHRLSSNPDKAEDALKLLHELRVHQVELDLQNEEIAANEQALGDELRAFRTLYDCAPFAYSVVDLQGTVVQANLAAGELFDAGRDGLEGQRIDRFLAPQSRSLLLGLLERVASGGGTDSCIVRMNEGAQNARPFRCLASSSPGDEYILLACAECGPGA